MHNLSSNFNEGVDIDFILNIISLYEIYHSRQKEKESDNFTNKLIHALANEVQKLHEENEIIIEQNREILDILRRKL